MAEAKKTAKTEKPEKPKDRIEIYDLVNPDGETVTVTHNIDTGETSVK